MCITAEKVADPRFVLVPVRKPFAVRVVLCSAVTVSFYYILNVSVLLNVCMSLLNGVGFFYIGRSYAIVTRKLKSMKKEYNDAFSLERVS